MSWPIDILLEEAEHSKHNIVWTTNNYLLMLVKLL